MKYADYPKAKKDEWRRRYRESAKGKVDRLKYRLKHRYGMSVDEYQQRLVQQNGVRAICRGPEIKRRRRKGALYSLSVDHCHLTGRNRALLCSACNTAIGLLRESPLLARAAATYLEQQMSKEFTGE